MNPQSDDELRLQLERRTTAAPLSHTERVELIESIHDRTVGRGQIRREWTVFRRLTAAVAVTVVALVVVLAYPRTSPSATAGPIGVPPASVVRTTQQLADSVAAGNSVGQVVLARGELESDLHLDRCQGRNPCYPRVLADTDPALQVDLGSYSTGPAGLGVLAFRIQQGYVTYLGQASVDASDEPWTVSNLFAQGATADPSILFAVHGWLVEAAILSCPMPLDIMSSPDLSYYCQASWLTPEKEYSVTSRTGNSTESRTAFEGSLNVQNGAYEDFAPEPAYGELGAEPREGVYLIAVNGCPKYRMGGCPVWKMVGRLDPLRQAQPVATPLVTPEVLQPSPKPSTGVAIGPNGYPVQIDGEPVYSGTAISDHMAGTVDDTPFLVAGTVAGVIVDCFGDPADFPDSPLLQSCNGSHFILDSTPAGEAGTRLNLILDGKSVGLVSEGLPVVLRVHIHDVRAADCPSNYRDRCESAVVVDDHVWPAAEASSSPGATSWWIWIDGVTTCGVPAIYRVDFGLPSKLGNCAGMLLTPPESVVLHLGQELDLHTFDGFVAPVDPPDGILRVLASDDGGATMRFRAISDGEITLMSTRGYCLDLARQNETIGPCALLDVRVVP